MTGATRTTGHLGAASASEQRERYLYSIVPAATAATSLQSDRDDVELVTVGDLSAVVGPVPPSIAAIAGASGERPSPEDTSPTLENLEAAVRDHEAVVEQILAATGSVVPIRFGTVLPSTDAVRTLLGRHAEALRAQLDALGGRREWGLRVRWEAEAASAAAAGLARVRELPPDDIEGPKPGHRYFARKRAERSMADAMRDACASVASVLADGLSPFATLQVRSGPRQEGPEAPVCVLDAAVLVAPENERPLSTALEAILNRHRGLSASLTGPWPPYSFVVPLPLEVQ